MTKPFLNYENQLELLEKRGIKIKNKEQALIKISNINYYKIKEFAEPFKKEKINEGTQEKEIYYENISFEGIVRRFYTDKNLRIYLFDALEKVELSLKTKIGYLFGNKYGPTGYLKFNHWCNKSKYCKYYIRDQEKDFKRRIDQYIVTRKNEFIKEALNSNKEIPIWLLTEILTFGDLVKLYELMSNNIRKQLAKEYGLDANTLETYLKNLRLIRNFSAHNTKIIDIQFKTLPSLKSEWKDYLFEEKNGLAVSIFILKELVSKINPKYGFGNVYKTLAKYIQHKNIKAQSLGFKDYHSIDYLFKNGKNAEKT